MSYWEMLRNGNIGENSSVPTEKNKTTGKGEKERSLTAYDRFMRKKQTMTPIGEQKPNVEVFRPKSINEVEGLIDKLKVREGLIVDLNKVGAASAQRMLDFLSGAVYALNGTVKHLKERIYVFSPEGVYLG